MHSLRATDGWVPLKNPYCPMESPRTLILKQMSHFEKAEAWGYEAADDVELRISRIVMEQQPTFTSLTQKQELAKRLMKLRGEILMDYQIKVRGERYADTQINENLNQLPQDALHFPHLCFLMQPENEPESDGWSEPGLQTEDFSESHQSDATEAGT